MNIITSIWESMLDADMNERYWAHLSKNNHQKNISIKIFLALMTSGTVASWSIWAEVDILWKVLSALAAAISIVFPILKLETMIERMSVLKGKWSRILNEYEFLWLSRECKNDSELLEEFKTIRKEEIEVSIEEKNLPYKKKLILKIQDEIIRARGLSNQI